MIKYALPGLYENYAIVIPFLKVITQEPHILNENVQVGAVYGNFQFCTWDGGRVFKSYKHSSLEEIQALQKIYNDQFQIPMRFIFTNRLIESQDCLDRFNNTVLTICQNDLNEVVVNSPILEDYIRQHYPSYKIISSTTKCLKKAKEANDELAKDYHLVCLDYNLNKVEGFLSSIPENQRDKVELLVNAVCAPNCENRFEHYRLNSMFTLSYGKNYGMRSCGIDRSTLGPTPYSTVLSPEEVKQTNETFHISNFKLEGRSFPPIGYLCQVVKYLIKPEYQLYTIYQVFQRYEVFQLDKFK